MTKYENKRLKQVETELAYLRKIIEEFISDKRVEIHYHYTYDLDQIKTILNYFKKKLEE